MAFGIGPSSIARNSSKAGSERTVAAAFLPGLEPSSTAVFSVSSAMSGLLPVVFEKYPPKAARRPLGLRGQGR